MKQQDYSDLRLFSHAVFLPATGTIKANNPFRRHKSTNIYLQLQRLVEHVERVERITRCRRKSAFIAALIRAACEKSSQAETNAGNEKLLLKLSERKNKRENVG